MNYFLDLKTVDITGGKTTKMTVRNMFYKGFLGKIRTIYYWLTFRRYLSFKKYLNLPVRYKVEEVDIQSYHSIDAEAELTTLLEQEANENKKKD